MDKKTKTGAPDPATAADRKLVKAACAPTTPAGREAAFQHILAQVSEFFESGFVIVSWTENGETFSLRRGIGNRFAVDAMVQSAADELVCGEPDDSDDDDELPA
jgi:hypothetical protein